MKYVEYRFQIVVATDPNFVPKLDLAIVVLREYFDKFADQVVVEYLDFQLAQVDGYVQNYENDFDLPLLKFVPIAHLLNAVLTPCHDAPSCA